MCHAATVSQQYKGSTKQGSPPEVQHGLAVITVCVTTAAVSCLAQGDS